MSDETDDGAMNGNGDANNVLNINAPDVVNDPTLGNNRTGLSIVAEDHVSTFIFIVTIVGKLKFGFTFGLMMVVSHIFGLTIDITETLSVGYIHCGWTLTSDIMFTRIKLFHSVAGAVFDVAIENING